MPRVSFRLLALLAACSASLAGCGSGPAPAGDTLKLGAYSVVREVFHDGLLPAFAARWKSKTGRELTFEESYNASGAQARSIASGFDADLAILSHEGDMQTLVKAGKVKADWNAGPDRGILTNSIVVIGHREGNPKQIRDWADLGKPGVGVLYADPKTSGGARWNINAIYGASRLTSAEANGGQPDMQAVRDLMARVQANVVNMDQSGRQSLANFSERQTGDAVVTYENELLLRNKEGSPIPYVIPPATLLIESPVAIVESSVERHGNRTLAEAFLEFLRSADGQRIFAEYGFRPVNAAARASSGERPAPKKLFTIADLGGWTRLEEELYGPKGLWTEIAAERSRAQGR
ncbi:MAG: sulfate ABC transporter substrate-binding protein [Isosphaeraceae bacterium]